MTVFSRATDSFCESLHFQTLRLLSGQKAHVRRTGDPRAPPTPRTPAGPRVLPRVRGALAPCPPSPVCAAVRAHPSPQFVSAQLGLYLRLHPAGWQKFNDFTPAAPQCPGAAPAPRGPLSLSAARAGASGPPVALTTSFARGPSISGWSQRHLSWLPGTARTPGPRSQVLSLPGTASAARGPLSAPWIPQHQDCWNSKAEH